MKKLTFFLFIILLSAPVNAQFALKGGVSYVPKEISNYMFTGQFYKDLLVVSGDLSVPMRKSGKLSGAGRIGLGFGNYRIRFAGDAIAMYENKKFRCGFGAETNLRLCGPVGIFARWSRTFPICEHQYYNEVLWKRGRSEISVGVVIDLMNGGCY